MVYLIQVGNYSRRQTFNKLFEKTVMVDDKIQKADVDIYFTKKYEGFSIVVKEIKEVEIIKDIQPENHNDDWGEPPKNAPKMVSSINNFKIEYTSEEKELHDKWNELSIETRKTFNQLHATIKSRYKRLFYSDTYDGYNTLDLVTNTFGTTCEKFCVKADLFIEAAKSCNGKIPESAAVEQEDQTTPNASPSAEFDPKLDELLNQQAEEINQTEGSYDSNNNGTYAVDDIPF
jgi:hypothetical protein